MHPCKQVYQIGASGKMYGSETGICRITGEQSVGLPFDKWVRDTFTDHASLKPGDIISNEALFCFDEASEVLQQKTGKEKLQRFRTYSHIVCEGVWYCVTKADKRLIFELICNGAELVCLTDSGQKHLLFKHRSGLWQLDDVFITPNIELLKYLHSRMCELMVLGLSQGEIISGNYNSYRIQKAGLLRWRELELQIKPYRGSRYIELAGWMLFVDK